MTQCTRPRRRWRRCRRPRSRSGSRAPRLPRALAPDNLADDVGRLGVGQHPGFHHHAHDECLPRSWIRCSRSASSLAIAAAGIFGWSGAYDRRQYGACAGPAGLPSGAVSRRPVRCGAARTRAAVAHRFTVPRPGYVVDDDLALERRAAGVEFVEAATTTASASMPPGGVPTLLPSPSMTRRWRTGATSSALSRRGPTAAPSPSRRARSPGRRASSAPAPTRWRPRAPSTQTGGAERVGQLGEPRPRRRVGERRADEPRGGIPVRVEPGGRRREG